MLSALNCARDYGDSHCHLFVDVNIQSKVSRMSHTWVTPSSSARVQGQRSSGHRTQHSGRQEPGHLRARGEPDAQFTGVRRPGAVASRRTQSSEDERSGYGHTQPLDRSDRRYEGDGIVRPEHEEPLNDSQPGRLQRSSQGDFYVQHPKPSQKQQLLTVAQKEESDYKQLKVAQRARVAEQSRQCAPQALGGNSHSEEELQKIRVKQERELQLKAKFAGIHQKQKREKYAEEKRRREEKELEDKKRVQREKAVRLEHKQEHEEQQRREEMRRKRLERFDLPKNT